MSPDELRAAWRNAYYRITCVYIATLVTLIFGFQMYRYFVAAPAQAIREDCGQSVSAISLIPVVGVFLDG